MALGKEYLESLGLEVIRKKFCSAAKVESVIEDFSRRIAELTEENAVLRQQKEKLATGREEIGEAILSAKTISQQIIAEAKEQAEAVLQEAREKADSILVEAEERAQEKKAVCETREQKTVSAVQDCYLQMREQCLDAVRTLDSEWQRFLCSFDNDEQKTEEALPEDLADKLGELAACLSEIDAEDEEKE